MGLLSDRQADAIRDTLGEHIPYVLGSLFQCACGQNLATDVSVPIQAPRGIEPLPITSWMNHVSEAIRKAVDAAYGPPVNKSHAEGTKLQPLTGPDVQRIRDVALPD